MTVMDATLIKEARVQNRLDELLGLLITRGWEPEEQAEYNDLRARRTSMMHVRTGRRMAAHAA